MKKIFSSVWHFIKNKYVAATLIFLLIFLFLGENSVMVTHKLNREIAALKHEADILNNDIRQDSVEARSLYGNPDALETYGREQYYMKRANEDIFIIKEE